MKQNLQQVLNSIDKANIINGTDENIAVFFENIEYLTDYIIENGCYELVIYICRSIDFDIDISGYNELLIGSIDKICATNPEKFIAFIFLYYMENIDLSVEVKTLFTNLLWDENYVNLIKSQYLKYDTNSIGNIKQKLVLLHKELELDQEQNHYIIPWLKNLKSLL